MEKLLACWATPSGVALAGLLIAIGAMFGASPQLWRKLWFDKAQAGWNEQYRQIMARLDGLHGTSSQRLDELQRRLDAIRDD